MFVSEAIQALSAGEFCEAFSKLYGEAHVQEQKQRYLAAMEAFEERFGNREIFVFSVPGRSEVCGNHTDHQHGQVLAAAITLDMIAVVAPCEGEIRLVSDNRVLQPIKLENLAKHSEEVGTSEGLVRGVAAKFRELGMSVGGFVGYLTSDVLQGSGLSSSAAFEVMIGTILSGLYNDMRVDPVVIAQVGQYAENVYFGKPCGLMDQCACSVGGLVHIDFADVPVVEKVDVDFGAFGHSLCIVDVHASHADLTAEYAAIPAEMGDVAAHFGKKYLYEVEETEFFARLTAVREAVGNDRAILRAIHLFGENARVREAVAALKVGDFAAFRCAVAASGDSSYRYLQNIYASGDEKNQAVALAIALSERVLAGHGVCRVHGGGFAGTIQAFVEDEYVAHYKREMETWFGAGSCHVLNVRGCGGVRVM